MNQSIPNNSKFIVDAYNLIFQCGLAGRSRDSMALERARQRLLSTIRQHTDDDSRAGIIVVFDARQTPIKEVQRIYREDGMIVAFAEGFADADSMIEQLIQSHSAPKSLTIVSSDHRLHKSASRRKAQAVDSDVWWDWLESGQLSGSPILESPNSESSKSIPNELADIDWAKEFGFEDDGV